MLQVWNIPIFRGLCDISGGLSQTANCASTWLANMENLTGDRISMHVFLDTTFPIESYLKNCRLALQSTLPRHFKNSGPTVIHLLATLRSNQPHMWLDISSKNSLGKIKQITIKPVIPVPENLPLFPPNSTECR